MNDKTHVDVDNEAIHFDMQGRTTYGEYLRLDKLLTAQVLRSNTQDEHLFIIIHQVSELWLSLILGELGQALDLLRQDALRPVFKVLSRITRAQTQLINVWDIVGTLTPTDYLRFRPVLGEASGFQSSQYRTLEFALGNKNRRLADVFAYDPAVQRPVLEALKSPSIYDETLRLLHRRGFELPQSVLNRDWAEPYKSMLDVERAWQTIYSETDTHWDLYELAEKLVDVEHLFQRWRFNHLKTVERLIGHRRGTGGTKGASYLQKALNLRFFPELCAVRTRL
jgi:tryptophan 2,3-dioxygenase